MRPQTLFSTSFLLPIEPFSVNKMYGRDRRHKTSAYKNWEMGVLNVLCRRSVQEKFLAFREAWLKQPGHIHVTLDFIFPPNVLYNKAGEISSRAEDLTNIEKPLVDLLFLPKVHVQPFPYGCPNFNVDDKHILRLLSRKLIGDRFAVRVRATIVSKGARP